jgi:hypothetical protein
VWAVALNWDGDTVVTAGMDGTAIVWDLTDHPNNQGPLVDRACAAAGGGLQQADWANAAPGIPYQQTCG